MTASSASSALMPKIGDLVAGKFVIERLIGQGGMGAVFAARHRELDSVVAIKVMLADTSNVEATARFKNEGRAAAKIRSQHVVRVEDVGEENGYAYMILELLEGEDLAQVLERRRRLPANEMVAYMLEALEGVRLAHDKGIIHRDLKPSNLFLARREDGSNVVKILDFGISKSSATSLAQTPGALTSTKAMLGSPLYMSPEQLRSSKSVDVRADIWALGVIMYELLTGTLPFMGESLGELFAAILETEPTPLRQRALDVPVELEAVVLRCLQRRPEQRFQTVVELVAAIAPFASGGATQPSGAYAAFASPQRTQMLSSPGMLSAPFAAHPASVHSQRQTPPGYPNAPSASPSMHGGMQVGVTTGTGADAPVVKGTVPLGASTPQPSLQQSSVSWQRTGNAPAPRSNTFAIAIAGCAAMVIVGTVLGGLAYKRSHEGPGPLASSNAVASSAPVAADPLPSASAIASVTASPTVSATTTVATETAAPTTPVVATARATAATHHRETPTSTPKVEPKATEAPKAPDPATTASAKPKAPATKPSSPAGAETSR